VHAQVRKKPRPMVTQLNQILDKYMLAEDRQEGQRNRVTRKSEQRLERVPNPACFVLGKVAAPQKRPLQ
jgi:hypothetical protein